MNVNQVTVIGRLGRDPEVRYTKAGTKVVTATVATSYTDKAGKETTEWHRVVAFKRMADQLAACHKGGLVVVQGRLQTKKWQDKEGNDKYTTEIVATIALAAQWHRGEDAAEEGRPGRTQQEAPEGASNDFDDDIPF